MNTKLFSSLVAVATVATGIYATPALAFDFVPQQEGEIDVGLGCYDNCIQLDPIFESIVSLTDSSSGSRSRLFVDNLSTANTYNAGGSNELFFKTKDAGTNNGGFFFRPSEYNEGSDYSEETGQLEVGTYTFNFSRVISELSIDFFDTESRGTGIMYLNGQDVRQADGSWINPGGNNNLQTRTFFDVSSITVTFGNDSPNGTGDGVNFRLSGTPANAAPEPFSMIGAGLALGAGALLKNRKK
ncbi:MAG: PEP-CTERM sorting domain-containing protein [Spirulina sp. SIO3F2]|nr:PEP-CTERM sorting domain-containing protein [Spirulina sp. SIO3F2]